MFTGGDYITPSPPPGTVSGGDAEPLHQAGEKTETPGGSVSPAPGGAPGNAGADISGGDIMPDILAMLPGAESDSGEAALYASTETVSGNGADTLQAVAAIQEGFIAVCMLLGFIVGILLMNGFFVWKARE